MIDISISELRKRIKENEYVPYKNDNGTSVINVCGIEIEASVYDNLVTQLYSSYNPGVDSYMNALNGKSMCGGDIQSLLQLRYEAEILIPGSTKQGINSFMLYGNRPYMVDSSLPLQEKAETIFKASKMSSTANPWLTMEGRKEGALQYTIDQRELKRAIREDLSQGKVKEGYCVPGGILGLQILLIGGDSELILEAQEVVSHSIETLKKMGKNQMPSEDLASQAKKLKEIQEYCSLLVASSENQKSASDELFNF